MGLPAFCLIREAVINTLWDFFLVVIKESVFWDLVQTIATICSLHLVVKGLKQAKWQTKFEMQINVVDGVRTCVDVVSQKENDFNEIYEKHYKGSTRFEAIEIKNWLAGSDSRISSSYVMQLKNKVRYLWPEKIGLEAVDFLSCYSELQDIVNNASVVERNTFGCSEQDNEMFDMADIAVGQMCEKLIPAYQKMMSAHCLENMEKLMEDGIYGKKSGRKGKS